MYDPDAKPRELNEQEFNEIQIRDLSGGQGGFGQYPGTNFSQQQGFQSGGFRPVELEQGYPLPASNGQPIGLVMDTAPAFIPPNVRDLKFQMVLSQAKMVKWMSVVEVLFCILFIVSGVYYLVLLLVLPICGYFAGRMLSRPLTIAFLLYLVVIIIVRIVLIVVVDDTFFRVIEVLMIVVDGLFGRYAIRFYKLLGTVEPAERSELLILQNGVNSAPPQNVNRQPPEAQFQPEFVVNGQHT